MPPRLLTSGQDDLLSVMEGIMIRLIQHIIEDEAAWQCYVEILAALPGNH